MLLSNSRFATALLAAIAAALLSSNQSSLADQVSLKVGVANPTMLSGKKETNFIRISLSGFKLPESDQRPPVNVAIVIDTCPRCYRSVFYRPRK